MRAFYIVIYFVFFSFLPGCCVSNSLDLRQILAGADTVEFIFFSQNSSPDTLQVTHKESITTIIYALSPKDLSAEFMDCQPEGRINFLKKRIKLTLLEGTFSMNASCTHISFIYRGKKYTKKISSEGVDFIRFAHKYKMIIEEYDTL